MALTCPNCGNTRNFLMKTLQVHVVQMEGERVEVAEEGRPGVIECLCDECDTTLTFDESRGCAPQVRFCCDVPLGVTSRSQSSSASSK